MFPTWGKFSFNFSRDLLKRDLLKTKLLEVVKCCTIGSNVAQTFHLLQGIM